jgi:hypothetical protein
MASLSKILNKGRRFLAGAGLASVLSLSGCSVMENMSDAEWISALGSAAMVAGGTEQEIIAGAVAKTIGDNQVQKEAAREGKTEVNVYGNSATQSLDYSKIPKEFQVMPKIFSCNYWEDKNRNNKIELSEVTGLKTEFYSNEPITITTEMEVEKDGKIEIEIIHNGLNVTDFIRSILDIETVFEEKYDVLKSGTVYVNHTFPPLSLSPGNYRADVIYKKKSKLFSWNMPHSEALNFKVR